MILRPCNQYINLQFTHPSARTVRRTPLRVVTMMRVAVVALLTTVSSNPTTAQAPPRDAGPDQAPSSTAPPNRPSISELRSIQDRLAALRPDQPGEYFKLAEDAADLRDYDLAQHLFVLAAYLDNTQFGRSACLAIADLALRQKNIERVRQMRALARLFPAPDRSAALSLDESQSPEAEYRHAGALVSALLGFYRTGYGSRGLKALDLDQQSYSVLAEYEHGIKHVSEILAYCRENTRCDLCENKLYIKSPGAKKLQARRNDDPASHITSQDAHDHFQVCPRLHTYRPQLSDDEIARQINIETALTGGRQARWGAQLALDGDAPRSVLDPSLLNRLLGIDATRTIYRDGQWTTTD